MLANRSGISIANPETGQLRPGRQPSRHTASPVRAVEDDRPDGIQADLQRQRRGATTPGWAGWAQVGQAAGQPGQHVGGQRRTRAV